ncbi:MAG: hypothetical protein GY852_01565, partial [bacterium]|nr:hypothetical protein [bacterium]
MTGKQLNKKKARGKVFVPVVVSRQEVKAADEKRLIGFLDRMHKGRELPAAYRKEILKEAGNIDAESRENTLKRVKHVEKNMDRKLTNGEKIKIWQNEYMKVVRSKLEGMVRKEAETRIDAAISLYKGKARKEAEKMRDKKVKEMQRYLAMNPNALRTGRPKPVEMPKKQIDIPKIMARLDAAEKEIKQLRGELK